MVVQAIKRKRVTRVGSGAWSVYLPKSWIDAWTPQQQAGREVDLHLVSGSLLIVPVVQDRSFAATAPASVPALRNLLLSAYVRGYDKVELRAPDRFPNEAIAAARDLLRHLDERIVATVGPDLIGFVVPPDGAARVDLLQSLGMRLAETVDLATECLEQANNDPDRVLHAARLLQSIQEEDVSRIHHQILRRVATLDLEIETVSDLQLLDVLAFLLDGLGSQCLALAATVLGDLGLQLSDLAYPRADLLRRLPQRPPPPAVARDILQGQRASLRDVRGLLHRLLAALQSGDLDALDTLQRDAMKAREQLQERVFEAVVRHWGSEAGEDAAQRAFGAYQLTNPLANLLSAIWACAGRANLYLAARKPPPVPA